MTHNKNKTPELCKT